MAAQGQPSYQSRYYFAYGSNMNRAQMARRFMKPDSQIHHYARAYLPHWKFRIVEGGYANIVKCTKYDEEVLGNDRVWGSIYEIEPEDEDILDGYEGVDQGLYTKEYMDFIISRPLGHPKGSENARGELEKVVSLVYVAVNTKPGIIKDEYIPRMEAAINDPDTALPAEYVEKWVRPELRPDRQLPEELS